MLDLTNKTVAEKSDLKASAIVTLTPKGKFSSGGLQVEIVTLSKIKGGVEVFARAWKGKEQIGFGADGSVEIERFRIFNPPVMIPTKTTRKMEVKLPEGFSVFDVPDHEENPADALRLVLSSIIKTVGKINKKVVAGKIGNTTDTFYPASDANSPCDGNTYRTSVDETWATIRAANGNGVSVSSFIYTGGFATSTTSNQYAEFYKGFASFDTSPLSGRVISSASIVVAHWNKSDGLGCSPTFSIYSATPNSTSNLIGSDQQTCGTTSFTTPKQYADLPSTFLKEYTRTLNSSGIAYINKTGITSFGFQEHAHDVLNSEPSWQSNKFAYAAMSGIEYATTSPRLIVESYLSYPQLIMVTQ